MISEQLLKNLKFCPTQYKWCGSNNGTDSLFWREVPGSLPHLQAECVFSAGGALRVEVRSPGTA